jgi:K+-transporting ATPase ATPase B chain
MSVAIRGQGRIGGTSAMTLQHGKIVWVEAGQVIPGDGEIMEGAALVDESAVTGQTDPILCEAGGRHSGVLAGSQVISGRILVRITTNGR